MSVTDLDLWTLAWIGLAMFLLWSLSLLTTDVSIVDIFWGPGFVLIAVASGRPEGSGARQGLVLILLTVWAIRLALHVFIRNRGKDEDPRYAAMRRRWGPGFGFVSLFTVFVLQGLLMWLVSLPVQAAIRADSPADLGLLDSIGTLVVLVGLSFETVGDLQLARFKRDQRNRGKVMDRGLWAYTRHPNYFGDFLVWWGFGLIALQTGSWWALLGPVAMTTLLLGVSGVPVLEQHMERRRPDYDRYQRETSPFFPLPRR